jgi:hypothetical protein
MQSVKYEPFMLSVIMLNVVLLSVVTVSVVVPFFSLNILLYIRFLNLINADQKTESTTTKARGKSD